MLTSFKFDYFINAARITNMSFTVNIESHTLNRSTNFIR